MDVYIDFSVSQFGHTMLLPLSLLGCNRLRDSVLGKAVVLLGNYAEAVWHGAVRGGCERESGCRPSDTFCIGTLSASGGRSSKQWNSRDGMEHLEGLILLPSSELGSPQVTETSVHFSVLEIASASTCIIRVSSLRIKRLV